LRRTVNNNFYATYKLQLAGRAFYPKPSLQRKQKNRFGLLFSLGPQLPGNAGARPLAKAIFPRQCAGFCSTPKLRLD